MRERDVAEVGVDVLVGNLGDVKGLEAQEFTTNQWDEKFLPK